MKNEKTGFHAYKEAGLNGFDDSLHSAARIYSS